ncbi:MAG TPA: oligosaccharide flippase family protein [Niabella sp.]|nr:oligosaccharide flippase family protein [Niabella sp.]
MLRSYFQKSGSFLKSSFVRNFTYVFAGNGLALLIGLAFTLIFSRIYTPEDYGLFALYMSLVTIAGQFVTLQYPGAFVIPKEEDKFFNLIRASLLCVALLSLLLFIVLLLAKNQVLHTFKAEQLGDWVYLIPIAVFLGGINDIWRSWNIRVKEFKKGALAKIASTLLTRFVTLGYGIAFKGGAPGLMLGDFMSKPADTILLQTREIRSSLPVIFRRFSLTQVWSAIKEFKRYPLFVLPGVWVYSFILQLPSFFLSIYFTKEQLGYYSMTNSLFVLPMSLLTTAIAPVFLQKIAETVNTDSKEAASPMVKRLFWGLHLAGLLPFSILIVFGDILLPFILGNKWEGAGVFASIMGYYFFFSINTYVLNSLYRVFKKEKVYLFINIGMILLCTVGLWIGATYYLSVEASIIGFSIANILGQLVHIAYNLKQANLSFLTIIFKAILAVVFVVSVLYGIKYLLFL